MLERLTAPVMKEAQKQTAPIPNPILIPSDLHIESR